MPGLTNNLSGRRKFGKKTLCVRKVRLQAANVMKVVRGILLLLIGELESICFFQDSNRREARTEKQILCNLSTISLLSVYIRHSVLDCLFAVETFPEPIVLSK